MRRRSFPTIKDPRPSKQLRINFGKPGRATLSPRHHQHRLLWRNVQAASKECCPSSPSEQNLPPLLFIQTHSSCLANYLEQWVPSESRVLYPRWEREILRGERILLHLHMRRAPLQACILIPFLCKGLAGGEREEGKPQNSLGHPFLSHTLKPWWQRLKAEGAKSHLQTPGSLWVWTGKQGELHSGISTGNEKYLIRPALRTNSVHSRLRSFLPLQGQKSAFLPLQEATNRNSPLDFHRESTQGRNPTLGRRIGANLFEHFSEAPNVLTSITRELP